MRQLNGIERCIDRVQMIFWVFFFLDQSCLDRSPMTGFNHYGAVKLGRVVRGRFSYAQKYLPALDVLQERLIRREKRAVEKVVHGCRSGNRCTSHGSLDCSELGIKTMLCDFENKLQFVMGFHNNSFFYFD